ncbi:MAG TPA: hypothetical protein P5555_13245 [Candidatus Paceibacterota bacterium]|nr:hypothetical protein [Verrucomicrobiota bacterium]HRZ46149.1 hypothetical protein [Candidatus Paceibacterota bacterium]
MKISSLTIRWAMALMLPLAAAAAANSGATGAPGEAFPEMRALWDRQPGPSSEPASPQEQLFRRAESQARSASEALYRCRRYLDGWLAEADPETGLIPRNLRESRDFWNGRDSAADNYPFMVLTAALIDPALYQGRMLDMLRTEQRLTARLDRLTDDYSFSKRGWRREPFLLDATIFDSAEYVKDGLVPLTEWLGPTPWSERMIGLVDDIWKHAAVQTPFGKIPTEVFEVNGDLLQACSRLFWLTGDRRYLDWAIRLGDYYLLGSHHPTRDLPSLRLMDHGGEVVNGLTELYVAVARIAPEKQRAYAQPLHDLLDCILEKGRNPDGMLYTSFQPRTGEHAAGLCDTWGYIYAGFHTVWVVDGTAAYRDAVRHALGSLDGKYEGRCWADKAADGLADSIEGALNLIHCAPDDSVHGWIDRQTRLMWAAQQTNGIIEGWHGDGNFARTSILYALWKTAGLHVDPWRPDVRVGAVLDQGVLYASLAADSPWRGNLRFDRPRHRDCLRLPLDYPRINRFPEWFAVEKDRPYSVALTAADGRRPRTRVYDGRQLAAGLPLELEPGRELRITCAPIPPLSQ